MKKIVLLAFVLWLLSISIFCTRLVVIVNGLETDDDVFPRESIQEAIDSAESGDIIFVHAGTYRERVVVNKRVSLIGEDKHNTIIDWNGTGSVVHVTADNTLIANFTLTLASRASAYPDSSICLYHSDGNNISNNIMTDSYHGLHLVESKGNTITGNKITNNEDGILLYKSSNNIISGNNITGNSNGIWLFESSKNNIISGNNVTNNDYGISLYDDSSTNIISGNNITDNGDGIYIYKSSNNIIYHNNFIDNAKHVDDAALGHNPPRLSVNFWDDGYPSGGNYWDDYLTRYPDAKEIDGSGIGDTPYDIYEKNQDNYPLLPYWFPPAVSIISPENKTYAVADVPLIFTVSEATSWMSYSLDGQMNVTVGGNITLVGLSDAVHTITVYAADTAGNTGHSDTGYFTVDTTLPSIIILSPENRTYAENDVPLSFTVDKAVSWMAYSLDGQANATITGNTTLTSLLDGVHYIVVYANTTAGKMGASNTVYFTVDTEAPIIIILSPKNETYASTSLSLNFTQSEPTFWMGYSLDGQTNVTVGGNTTLVGLSEGIHTITVYAADTAGNTGSSDIVYFTVDTVSVSIDLLSPENKTYTTDSVSLSFEVDEETSWMGYSLDGQANNTITGDTTLIGLSDGTHSLVVYASDMLGNTGSSDTVYFTIDTVLPNIEIISPENKTYAVADVLLSLTVSETTSWMGYSLDGQTNVTVSGNTTLVGLSEGIHTITVYANDTAGNTGHSDTVYFTINALPPNIELFSPENKTYTTNSVSLSFDVNEPTLWKGYSLDGQANVTIFGDITLSGLSEGSHSLIVYVKDMAGNAGSSGIVYFAVDTREAEPLQLWVVAVVVMIAGVGFALTGYMAYDLFKRAKK